MTVDTPTQDDSNKTFRTRLVGIWLFMNAVLAIVLSRLSATTRTRYFQGLLWATFGLSMVRFG